MRAWLTAAAIYDRSIDSIYPIIADINVNFYGLIKKNTADCSSSHNDYKFTIDPAKKNSMTQMGSSKSGGVSAAMPTTHEEPNLQPSLMPDIRSIKLCRPRRPGERIVGIAALTPTLRIFRTGAVSSDESEHECTGESLCRSRTLDARTIAARLSVLLLDTVWAVALEE